MTYDAINNVGVRQIVAQLNDVNYPTPRYYHNQSNDSKFSLSSTVWIQKNSLKTPFHQIPSFWMHLTLHCKVITKSHRVININCLRFMVIRKRFFFAELYSIPNTFCPSHFYVPYRYLMHIHLFEN